MFDLMLWVRQRGNALVETDLQTSACFPKPRHGTGRVRTSQHDAGLNGTCISVALALAKMSYLKQAWTLRHSPQGKGEFEWKDLFDVGCVNLHNRHNQLLSVDFIGGLHDHQWK